MEQEIKEKVRALGADVCGIGATRRFADAPEGFRPQDIYPNCKSVISFGLALPKGVFELEPQLIYAHFNGEICHKVDEVALEAAKWMEREYGATCIPIPCDSPVKTWDKETLTAKGMISMKHAAVGCGLGELGKSTLFLNREYGSRLILGAVLTNLELASDPLETGICIPGCRKCVEHCPSGAIQEGRVVQKLCREVAYGKMVREFGTVECNTCRRICPRYLGC